MKLTTMFLAALVLSLAGAQAIAGNHSNNSNKKGPQGSVEAATGCTLEVDGINVNLRVETGVRDKSSGDGVAVVTEWCAVALAKINPGRWDELDADPTVCDVADPVTPRQTVLGTSVMTPSIVDGTLPDPTDPPPNTLSYWDDFNICSIDRENTKALNALIRVTYGTLKNGTVVDKRTIENQCGGDPEFGDNPTPKITSESIAAVIGNCPAP